MFIHCLRGAPGSAFNTSTASNALLMTIKLPKEREYAKGIQTACRHKYLVTIQQTHLSYIALITQLLHQIFSYYSIGTISE